MTHKKDPFGDCIRLSGLVTHPGPELWRGSCIPQTTEEGARLFGYSATNLLFLQGKLILFFSRKKGLGYYWDHLLRISGSSVIRSLLGRKALLIWGLGLHEGSLLMWHGCQKQP